LKPGLIIAVWRGEKIAELNPNPADVTPITFPLLNTHVELYQIYTILAYS